jgi:hypothetical protein
MNIVATLGASALATSLAAAFIAVVAADPMGIAPGVPQRSPWRAEPSTPSRR